MIASTFASLIHRFPRDFAMMGLIGGLYLFSAPSQAAEHCFLENPRVIVAAEAKLAVTLRCKPTPTENSVRYPVGKLYLGVSLYNVTDDRLRRTTVRLESEWAQGRDILPIEIVRPDSAQEVTFPLGNIQNWTHFQIAVWDQKNECRQDVEVSDCRSSGFTLGAVDDSQLPIPVDAWPRPICNVTQLKANGFFAWVEREGQLGDPEMDDRYRTAYAVNDCWKRFPNRLGLGYSVRRWRVGPLKP
jgi:hypothetical protein